MSERVIKNKIVIYSDVHIGNNPVDQRDKYAVSKISWSRLETYEKFLDHLCSRKDVFLIIDAGDFFHSKVINPTIERYIHLKIFPKLRKAGIGLIIVGGNHDTYTDSNQGCSIDNLDIEQNCIVVRDYMALNSIFSERRMRWLGRNQLDKINGWFLKASKDDSVIPLLAKYKIGFTFLPFKNINTIIDEYYRQLDPVATAMDHTAFKKLKRDLTYDKLQVFIAERLIPYLTEHLDGCNAKLMIGHYRLGTSSQTSIDECEWLRSMVHADKYAYVIFGHIHAPSKPFTDNNIMHIGSFDRDRFDEMNDKKQYLILNAETHELEAVSLDYDPIHPDRPHARRMREISITIPHETVDPNTYVLERILKMEGIKDIHLKIFIQIPSADAQRLDIMKIKRETENICASVAIDIQREYTFMGKSVSHDTQKTLQIDIPMLFTEFINSYESDPNIDVLKSIGKKLIDDSLQAEIDASIKDE